ncbi:hypothetical protein BLNAU_4540 [Blattamonas nauphoetae]|uniref:Uncharacterized protein n=1 Tax=Blattamonas nauphoetae TaxID=2049346 RepID=A0ABQ9Y9F3_9EUKA|nr:hypothetical protein BLNAU_4540 [Blattamonas nauphoetae]
MELYHHFNELAVQVKIQNAQFSRGIEHLYAELESVSNEISFSEEYIESLQFFPVLLDQYFLAQRPEQAIIFKVLQTVTKKFSKNSMDIWILPTVPTRLFQLYLQYPSKVTNHILVLISKFSLTNPKYCRSIFTNDICEVIKEFLIKHTLTEHIHLKFQSFLSSSPINKTSLLKDVYEQLFPSAAAPTQLTVIRSVSPFSKQHCPKIGVRPIQPPLPSLFPEDPCQVYFLP